MKKNELQILRNQVTRSPSLTLKRKATYLRMNTREDSSIKRLKLTFGSIFLSTNPRFHITVAQRTEGETPFSSQEKKAILKN